MTDQTPSLKIGLLDNSYHSLKRGYEMWSQWKKTEDAWLLKESVIWVHHGIELALKQLLVQTNEYLVFDDVDRAIERLSILRRNRSMANAGVLDLFDHDEKVMSVGFRKLIDRCAITLTISELLEKEPLRSKINELTKYRNKVVHFSIELDITAVSNLLSDILEPLLSLLSKEVKDINFINNCIPDIRSIAQPLRKFVREMQLEIADDAVKATLKALPPRGNRRAGIVYQTIGSGLTSSMILYLAQARFHSKIRNHHVIVVTDRLDLAKQVYSRTLDLAVHDKSVRISLPEDKASLVEALNANEPLIIISTFQKLDKDMMQINQECLLVGFNLHAPCETLIDIFPNATYILFTSVQHLQDTTLSLFGEVVCKYDFQQALEDRVLTPVSVEQRTFHAIAENTEYYKYTTVEFLNRVASDIVKHFKLRQNNWVGKGIVIVPDLKTGNALYKEMANVMDWQGNSEGNNFISTISASVSADRRGELLERFMRQDDPLIILICTGQWFFGVNNPLIHTAYVISSLSQQLRHMLLASISRPYPGKENGLVVDYMKLNWDMEGMEALPK